VKADLFTGRHRRWILLVLTLCLSGCPLIISLDYVPSNSAKGQGPVQVGDFIYRPATQGSVRPREVGVPSEGIGRIFLSGEIGVVFRDALKRELTHSGYQVNQVNQMNQMESRTQAQAATPVISGVVEKYALLEPGVFEVAASFAVIRQDGTRQDLACQARHNEGVIEVMIKTAMRNCIQQFILSGQEATVF
jgi:hypothetical protein